MDFLNKYNITNEEIEDINKFNSKNVIKNIEMNKNNVINIIEYLQSLGVNNEAVRDLFKYQIGIFFKTKEEIETVFDEYEIDSIVKSLNYDVNTIDLIEFN